MCVSARAVAVLSALVIVSLTPWSERVRIKKRRETQQSERDRKRGREINDIEMMTIKMESEDKEGSNNYNGG